jgi:tetrahydromethanopterin S-methyltransferase subunit F
MLLGTLSVSDLKADIDAYVKLVKARSQLIARGNEQQTKDIT